LDKISKKWTDAYQELECGLESIFYQI
jgi:hypothetical protein